MTASAETIERLHVDDAVVANPVAVIDVEKAVVAPVAVVQVVVETAVVAVTAVESHVVVVTVALIAVVDVTAADIVVVVVQVVVGMADGDNPAAFLRRKH